MAEADEWRKQAEHWKAIADQEATRCAAEYGAEIARLKQKNRMLERQLAAASRLCHGSGN